MLEKLQAEILDVLPSGLTHSNELGSTQTPVTQTDPVDNTVTDENTHNSENIPEFSGEVRNQILDQVHEKLPDQVQAKVDDQLPNQLPDPLESKSKHRKSISLPNPLDVVKRKVNIPKFKLDNVRRTNEEDDDDDEMDIAAQPNGIAQSIFSIFAANSKSKAAGLDEFEGEDEGEDYEDTSSTDQDKYETKPYDEKKLRAASSHTNDEVVLATKLTQELHLEIDLPHKIIPDNKLGNIEKPKHTEDKDSDDGVVNRPLSENSRNIKRLVSFLHEKLAETESTSQSMLTNKIYKSKTEKADRDHVVETKLRELIDLDDDDELVSDYTCWLWRNILLQGYFYITKKKLCFLSYLPRKDTGAIIHSGSLNKKARKTSLYNKFWCILKNDSFSYYNNATDLYFPEGTIDLRYALNASLEPLEANDSTAESTSFVIICEGKSYSFKADTHRVAAQWVKAIQKEIFRSHNEGDRVKIIIPYENIIDIEKSQVFEFAETFKFKVIESDETYALDEYLFSFFKNGKLVMETVHSIMSAKDLVLDDPFDDLLSQEERSKSLQRIYDSTRDLSPSPTRSKEETKKPFSQPLKVPRFINKRKSNTPVKNETDLKGSDNSGLLKVVSEPIKRSGSFSSLKRILPRRPRQISPPSPSTSKEPTKPRASKLENNSRTIDPDVTAEVLNNTAEKPTDPSNDSIDSYSCEILPSFVDSPHSSPPPNDKSWADYAKRIGKVPFKVPILHKVTEMWVGGARHFDGDDNENHFGTSSREKILSVQDKNTGNQRFRNHFALGDSETLKATYFCYLYRGIPVYGKVYVSRNYLCFRSLLPGTKTKMILPLRDIENVTKENGFKFGYSGLVVVIHGHEEVFFEFSSANNRDDCEMVCLQHLDELHKQPSTVADESSAMLSSNMAKLCSFEDALKNELAMDLPPVIISDDLTESIKHFSIPVRKFHFTMFTIGSRGDIQPYISLAKGLLAEGHKVRIATHAEFQPWIEKYGIEFREVAGDPSELMKIMVEHGMFSMSFLREASSKFRTWIDELLLTSWEACQGTDILIESPSAMAGIHIAEALNIPYFRAFTMPWSRTRAYPHSFIVPDQKMGGSYNYLTYVMFDNVFWKGIAGQVNRWRKKTLHLPATNLELMQQNKVPFLYNVSPSVLPPPLDFNDWITVSGYWFLDEGSANYEPPTDLVEFMALARKDGKKLVYIGFGSIVVSDPKELTRAVIDSVLKADVRCVLSKGWSDRLDKKNANEVEVELPPEVFQIQAAPHDWLFPQMDAAVHHGGSGSTGASLRAGLPTIIKPFFGDQFFYANRVEDLGVGIYLKKLNVKQFSRALWQATHNERIIARAADIGTHIRAENGVQKAISTIYRDLDYARSLVEAKQIQNKKRTNNDATKYAIYDVNSEHDQDQAAVYHIDGQWSPDSWMMVDHEA